jgi:hypothetical protein
MPFFRVLFLAAAVDCYLHGPGAQIEKAIAAIACVVACLINFQWGFILAELVWVGVFIKAYIENEKQKQSSHGNSTTKQNGTITTTSPPPPTTSSTNAVPKNLKSIVDSSMELYLKNEFGPVTCDGVPWVEFKSVDGIKIERADYPGRSFKRWRITADGLYGPSEGVYKQLFDYNVRCPPNGWDHNIAWGKIVKEFDDYYRIVNYATASAAGGAVSSREFVEIRHVVMVPTGGFYLSGLSVDDSMVQPFVPGFKGASAGPAGTRATSYPGGGARLQVMEGEPSDINVPRMHRFVMVTNVDLSGWLTQGLINSATTDALIDSTNETRAHLNRLYKKQKTT